VYIGCVFAYVCDLQLLSALGELDFVFIFILFVTSTLALYLSRCLSAFIAALYLSLLLSLSLSEVSYLLFFFWFFSTALKLFNLS